MGLLGDVGAHIVDSVAGATLAGGVRVSLKTDLGPEILIYDSQAAADGKHGASVLGIAGALIVRNGAGGVLTTVGEPPATNPVKVALILAALAAVAVIIGRGLRR